MKPLTCLSTAAACVPVVQSTKNSPGANRGQLCTQPIHVLSIDWLATSNVQVRQTSTAFKPLRKRGWDAVSGRTTTRRAIAIAISVWYEEPKDQGIAPQRRSTPDTWILESK